MKSIIFLLLLTVFCLSSNLLLAQEKEKKKQKDYSASILFENKEPISIELYINKKNLFRDIGDDRKYHPAIIKHLSADNQAIEIPLKVQTRGNFRRNPDNCNMAPLSFKFSENDTKQKHIFSGQKKLKLVVPCKHGSEKFQEYVILEYLVYQFYELFTPAGYRTRLVNISLIDSMKQDKPLNYTGFFIEETDQMALRNSGQVKEFKKYHPEQVNREQMTMVNVFQYMIGNTDWSVEVGHNIKLLFIQNESIPFAIPYDFDWAGIVNAPYAVPAPHLGLTGVTERLYRGYLRKMEEYDPVIAEFNSKKEEIYQMIRNNNLLGERTKNTCLKYLDDFYETINNPKTVKREFIDKCRRL